MIVWTKSFSFFLFFFSLSVVLLQQDQSGQLRRTFRSSRKASRWVVVKLQFLVDMLRQSKCGLHARSRGGFEMVQKLSTGVRCEGKHVD